MISVLDGILRILYAVAPIGWLVLVVAARMAIWRNPDGLLDEAARLRDLVPF